MSNTTVAAKSTEGAARSLFTPFNIVTGIILVLGLFVSVVRFAGGLGAVTALDDVTAWGLWNSVKFSFVPMAGSGYVACAAYYIFGMRHYHSAVRPAVLTGLLGYTLFCVILGYDVGRPWRLPYPLVYSMGTTSFLYEIGMCVALYLTMLFLEFCPAILEWMGLRNARKAVVKAIMVFSIFGILLSTLHQSSLGALFLMAPHKLHPLWYSGYMAVYFFISSIFCGLAVVIVVDVLSYRYLKHKMDDTYLAEREGITLGFGKSASLVMAGYFIIKVFGTANDDTWHYLTTPWGLWYLVELLGFVALPCLLFAMGAREKNLNLIRWTAVLTIVGVILNRFNVSLIAINWYLPWSERYIPIWSEYAMALFVITVGVLVFRFCALHMPVFYEHSEYKDSH